MLRSLVTIDLGAVRHNVARAAAAPRPRGALGRRQGRRLRARRGRRRARGTRGGRDRTRALPPSARRSSSARLCPARGSSSSVPRIAMTSPRHETPGSSSASPTERSRKAFPSTQARHRHGPLGLSRAHRTRVGGCRADEPLRLGRHGPRVHRAAARSVPLGDRAVCAPDAAYREQRRHPAPPCFASRRGSLRDRRLRHLALRHRPRRRRPAAGASLGVLGRTCEIAPAGESTGYGRRFVAPGRPGSGSFRSAMPTASGAT